MVAWEMGLFVSRGSRQGSHVGFPPFQLLHPPVPRACPSATTIHEEKHAAKRQPNGGAIQRSCPVPLSAGSILGASEMGEKPTNCRCAEEDEKY